MIHDVESERSEFVLCSRRTLLPEGDAHCLADALVVVRDGRIADVIHAIAKRPMMEAAKAASS